MLESLSKSNFLFENISFIATLAKANFMFFKTTKQHFFMHKQKHLSNYDAHYVMDFMQESGIKNESNFHL